jgi:aerobic-type carbon monoxide dehydrogenase small subunit (CoxS/CutS family)
MATIAFTLNGRPTRLEVDGTRRLLWVLRTELGLTGTKYGCGAAQCGACTVVIDREPARACQVSMADVQGRDVVTIEGLAHGASLHPLQAEFAARGALQCGFCTPGMIMSAYGLLLKHPHATRDEIVAEMDDNLCRCGAHQRILEAIEAVAGGVK